MEEKKNIPKLRFPEFTGEWEQRKLGEVTKELSEYDNFSSGLPLLTSARTGLMYQSDYRGNTTTDNENTLFSVVPLNACTYRHMSDDSTFHLNINTLEKGLVSKEYPVFVENESNLKFIVPYINSSSSFTKFCSEQKKGGTRTRLYYKTLCEYQMMMPLLDEQNKIADYFTNLDNLITLHQRKLELLEKQKKAVMQAIFSRKVRFKKEDGSDFTEWEEKSLDDLLQYEQPTKYLVSSTDYKDEYKTPVLTAGQSLILGYTDETNGIYEASEVNPVIIFDDFTTSYHWIDFPFKVKSSAMKMLTMKTDDVFEYVYFAMGSIDYRPTSHSRQWISTYSQLTIPMPHKDEQKLIADFLTSFDEAIATAREEFAKWKELRKGLLQQMFV